MWINDIIEVLNLISKDLGYRCCVEKIENNIIYFTSGARFPFYRIKELIPKQDKAENLEKN